MRPDSRVVFGFLMVGVVAVSISALLVQRISTAVDEIQELHSPALELILNVRGSMANGVQASLAYLVSSDVDDKQECLRRFGQASASLISFTQVAQLDKPGEERERALLGTIRTHQADLEQHARKLFQKLDETGSVDTVGFDRYKDIIDQTFAATDELVALEHDEVREGQDLALQTVKRARLSLWGVAVSVLLFGLVVGGILRRALQEAEQALAERQALRDRFVERSIAVQDNERQRVARELHDETGQALSALSVGLRELSESRDLNSVRETAQRLQRTAEGLVHEVGRLVQGLHPQLIEDHGLVAAIEQMTSEFQAAHDLVVDIDLIDVDGRLDLSSSSALAVYRMVQEALNNVARHAEATHVGVYLRRSKNELRVVVEDDGRGFDFEAVRGNGVGLQSMRERAASLGAQLVLESEPGVGTTVAFDVPLP